MYTIVDNLIESARERLIRRARCVTFVYCFERLESYEAIAGTATSLVMTESDIRRGEMRTVDIHEAQRHLFELVEQAACGGSFLIATSGRPRVMAIAFDSTAAGHVRRLDFSNALCVPEDFDQIGNATIEQLLGMKALRAEHHPVYMKQGQCPRGLEAMRKPLGSCARDRLFLTPALNVPANLKGADCPLQWHFLHTIVHFR